MLRSQIPWLMLTSLTILSGCGRYESSFLEQATVSPLGDAATLGSAYDNRRKMFTGAKCVRIDPKRYADVYKHEEHTDGQIYSERDLGFQALNHLLSGSLELEVPILPMISLAGSAEYAAESAGSEYAENFVFAYPLKKSMIKISDADIDLDELFYEQITGKNDPNNERKPPAVEDVCGQEYVSQIDFGGEFFATMKVEFSNKFDKEKFGGAVAARLGSGDLSLEVAKVKLQHMTEQSKEGLKITVSALQRGGNPNAIFPYLAFNNDADQSALDIIHCNFETMQNCRAIFERLVDYGRNEFSRQLNNSQQLVPIRLHTSHYQTTELLPARKPNEREAGEIAAKIKDLQAKLSTNQMHLKRAHALLDLPQTYYRNISTQYGHDQEQLHGLMEALQANALIYLEALRFCLEDPDECIKIADQQFLPTIQTYDIQALNAHTTSFAQWCSFYLADRNSTDVKMLHEDEFATLRAVMLRLEQNSGKPIADCQDAMQRLDKLTEMSLAYAEISNLEPISSLVNLRKLILAHNPQLEDLTPIKRFNALWHLDISHTGVHKVGTFLEPGWEDLAHVDMRGGRIDDREKANHDFWKTRKLLIDTEIK